MSLKVDPSLIQLWHESPPKSWTLPLIAVYWRLSQRTELKGVQFLIYRNYEIIIVCFKQKNYMNTVEFWILVYNTNL
jgi:hypothetical protein